MPKFQCEYWTNYDKTMGCYGATSEADVYTTILPDFHECKMHCKGVKYASLY